MERSAPSSAIGLAMVLLATSLPHGTLAQNTEPVPSPGFWGSVYVMGGGSRVDRRPLFISDFRRLAPGSTLLEHDFADHVRRRTWFPDNARVSALSVGIRPFRSDERPGPELRLGVTHAGGSAGELHYERRVREPYDTLVSSGGTRYTVDSVFGSDYDLLHRMDRIGLDASLVFRTKGRSRWSLHGGAGLGFGALFNARTEITHRTRSTVEYPNGSSSNTDRESLREEVFDNSGGAWVSVYAPLGVGFRLSRKGEFLRRIDLFLESRPQMLLVTGTDLGGTSLFGVQSLFGARVRLD